MIPAKFDYHRAASLDEAIALLGDHPEAKVLAGGHSLLPMMKLRLAQPPSLVDIGRVAELKGIRQEGGKVRVGALTTHHQLHTSELLGAQCPLLAAAAGEIGDPLVRNRGTIGGNIAHADPASDLPAVLLALDAQIVLQGPAGERRVAAGDFFLELLTTDLKPGELLTAIELRPQGPAGSAYLKHEHPASGFALCGAAALVELDRDGRCVRARLCFNGVTATPHDATGVAEALRGLPPVDAEIDQAVNDNLDLDDPLGDLHASPTYRFELAKVYGRRALKQARNRAAR